MTHKEMANNPHYDSDKWIHMPPLARLARLDDLAQQPKRRIATFAGTNAQFKKWLARLVVPTMLAVTLLSCAPATNNTYHAGCVAGATAARDQILKGFENAGFKLNNDPIADAKSNAEITRLCDQSTQEYASK